MITLNCDRCGEKIPPDTNGGVRIRTGNRELSFHLCGAHQAELRRLIEKFCEKQPPREVHPSLRKP